jgi:nicotinamidase-related amidase
MNELDRLTLHSDHSLLLIIDIQEKLAPAIAHAETIIHQTGILIEAAAALDVPILATEQYPKGLGPTVAPLQTLLHQTDHFRGIFEKLSFSALTPEVLAALQESGRSHVIIAGMETHVCVFQTARELVAKGFVCQVAGDAVGSRTDERRDNGLELIRACGGVVTNTETVLFDWLKQAGTPVFRQLSRLIR